MDDLYKGDIFKKLKEIKEWQAKQEEKRLIHLKEQQAVLAIHHKKTMEMLESKRNANKAIPFKEFPFDPVFNHSSENIEVTSHKGENREGSPCSDFDKENIAGNVSMDDVPVKPVQKDFHQLLEEKIKKNDPGIIPDGASKSSTVQPKQKRTFLKKGEGLKRFRMKPEDGARTKSLATVEKPSRTVTSSPSLTVSSQKLSPVDSNHGVPVVRVKECNMNADRISSTPGSKTWANFLAESNNIGKENKCSGTEKKTPGEKKTKYEGVDLEVFELLEQMAGDSSFCSTSSTLLGFMESPVISTPLKAILEKKECSTKSTKQLSYGLDTSGEDSDDSKGDFDSSSDSCYSESHKAISAPSTRSVNRGVARVHFSNHVEEREFYPSAGDSSVKESPNASKEEFRDTEVWSENDSSDDDQQTTSKLSEGLNNNKKPTEKLQTSQFVPEPVASSPDSKEESHNNEFQAKPIPGSIFKSELLRQRVLELEHEIEKFKRENEKLNNMKKQHEKAHAEWLKEKRETEKKLQEKEELLKNTVLEERKKFNREKQVFERYCKDLRNQPTKQEREEVQSLQQKLATLQQEMRQRESRNTAAQARITTRLKTLENENSQLKEEVEKLKKEKLLAAKKSQCRINSKSNTKSLHTINDQLSHLQNPDREQCLLIRDVIPKQPIPAFVLREESKVCEKQRNINQNKPGKLPSQRTKTARAMSKQSIGQRSSLRRIHSVPDLMEKETADVCENFFSEDIEEDSNKKDGGILGKSLPDNDRRTDKGFHDVVNLDNLRVNTNFDKGESVLSKTLVELSSKSSKSCPDKEEKGSEMANKSLLEIVCDSLYPKDVPSSQIISSQRNLTHPSSVKVYPFEKINPDGSHEIRYENGNFKLISSDGLSSKLFYYNGDVKESLQDGTVKYYYSETRTWHTNFADGLEVLEFPNGQVERHCNGTTEVSFPDGTIRIIHPNGKEEVMLTDGTVATVEPNGHQLIQLPNGQKEYHTKEYKKRVYPDGTVKIVYSDGVQETRYANGRVRLKDADGNLVMDQNPEGDDS